MPTPPVLPRISDSVALHAGAHPEREALVLGDARWSHGRMADEVDRFAASLWRTGLRKGDRVAMMATPRPECFLAFLAAASIGGIPQRRSQPWSAYPLRCMERWASPT